MHYRLVKRYAVYMRLRAITTVVFFYLSIMFFMKNIPLHIVKEDNISLIVRIKSNDLKNSFFDIHYFNANSFECTHIVKT